MIACVFIRDFTVVAAREHHGISPDWPLIVATYTKHRDKVFAVSPEVRLRGVKPGMAVHKGLALCPQAVVVGLAESPQRRARDTLLEALCGFSDRLELVSDHSGTIWIDLGNMPDVEVMDRARQIRKAVIDQTPFFPAVGLASGKFPARIAAVTAGEGSIQWVAAGDEKVFLASFPVARLALTKKQLEHFRLLGIETLGQLAALPTCAAQEQFGAVGKRLHALAHGIDAQPVASYTPRLKHYRQQQFEPAVEDRTVLEAVLRHIAGEVAAYLASKGLTTQDIVLAVRLDNRQVIEKHFILRETIASQMSLYANLVRLLHEMDVTAPVTGLEVGIENLSPPVPRQLDFFGHLFAEPGSITRIVDHLAPRYGTEPFGQISLNPHDGGVPERRFRFRGVA